MHPTKSHAWCMSFNISGSVKVGFMHATISHARFCIMYLPHVLKVKFQVYMQAYQLIWHAPALIACLHERALLGLLMGSNPGAESNLLPPHTLKGDGQ
jgi:hypothetical protein